MNREDQGLNSTCEVLAHDFNYIKLQGLSLRQCLRYEARNQLKSRITLLSSYQFYGCYKLRNETTCIDTHKRCFR